MHLSGWLVQDVSATQLGTYILPRNIGSHYFFGPGFQFLDFSILPAWGQLGYRTRKWDTRSVSQIFHAWALGSRTPTNKRNTLPDGILGPYKQKPGGGIGFFLYVARGAHSCSQTLRCSTHSCSCFLYAVPSSYCMQFAVSRCVISMKQQIDQCFRKRLTYKARMSRASIHAAKV